MDVPQDKPVGKPIARLQKEQKQRVKNESKIKSISYNKSKFADLKP